MRSLYNTVLLASLVVSVVSGYCYDAQVAEDQYFDDSFVCKDKNLTYPAQLIDSDLEQMNNNEMRYFLDTATSCYNETNFFSNSYTAMGDYAYQCICPTRRRRIEAVYVRKNICFVVLPKYQDIQYAQCSGHCSFDYGTPIANAARGYFCVHNAFVQREFVVWCPNLPKRVQRAAVPSAHASGRHLYRPFGTFQRVAFKLPTLCNCRGYFCDHHAAAPGVAGGLITH